MDKITYNEYHKRYNNEKYHSRREMFISELGGICSKCSSSENLEFDHIDPKDKIFSIGDRLANANEEELRVELLKCQLLCKSCHSEKTAAQLSVDHGGGLSGKKNCKCDLCRKRKAEYMRNYYLTRFVKSSNV